MSVQIYRDDVFDPCVELFKGSIGNNFLLMGDNNDHLNCDALMTNNLEDKETQ